MSPRPRLSKALRAELLAIVRELEHGNAFERAYVRKNPDANRYALRTGAALYSLGELLDLNRIERADRNLTAPPDAETIAREDAAEARREAEREAERERRARARRIAQNAADPLGRWHGRNE